MPKKILTDFSERGVKRGIFISHAHDDQNLAQKLIDYLLDEFNISKDNIRCSSVPDHMLKSGETIVEHLYKDLKQASILIALLSYTGLESSWVKFEIGAAWGQKKHIIPILGPGFNINDGRLGPVASMACIFIEDKQSLEVINHQIHRIAHGLGLQISRSETALKKLQIFIDAFVQWGGDHADFTTANATIFEPGQNSSVSPHIKVKFDLQNIPANGCVWVGVAECNAQRIWPKENLSNSLRPGEHVIEIIEGGSPSPGELELCIIGVGKAGDNKLKRWLEETQKTGNYPFLARKDVPGLVILDKVTGLTLKK